MSAPLQGLWRPGPAGVAAAQQQPVQAETGPDLEWALEPALVGSLLLVDREQRRPVQPLQATAPVQVSEGVLSPEPAAL